MPPITKIWLAVQARKLDDFVRRASTTGLWVATACATFWTVAAAGEPPPSVGPKQAQSDSVAPKNPSPEAEKQGSAEAAPHISGPRELLALYGLDESRLNSFIDGRPIGGDEIESLMRFLFAVRRFSLADIDRGMLRDASWQTFGLAPAEHRGQIVPLSGRVVSVAEEKPLPEIVARFDLPRYYRCSVRLGDNERAATIYALSVPQAWKLDRPLDERIAASAFFVKFAAGGDFADGGGKPLEPVFVAQRLAWHPNTPLGDLEMDQGLFDELSEGGSITNREREAFYQLLAAVGRAGTNELARHARNSPDSLIELLQHPKQHTGELVLVDGIALRALLVRVDDPDIVARFGIDHYYELEMSVDLERPVKLDGELYGSFPVVVCVRQLPSGMPIGERIHEHVRVPAFFVKIWAYRTERTGADEAGRRQIAPLLIGREPLWIQDEVSSGGTYAGAILVGLFVAGIAVLWLVVWRFSRGDARFRDRALARKHESDAGVSLDELALRDPGAVDVRQHESPADT